MDNHSPAHFITRVGNSRIHLGCFESMIFCAFMSMTTFLQANAIGIFVHVLQEEDKHNRLYNIITDIIFYTMAFIFMVVVYFFNVILLK